MKKVLVLFIAIFTACMMLTGCGKKGFEGKWALESAKEGDTAIDKKTFESLGMDKFYIQLDKDSKCKASMMGMEAEGTWKEVKDGVEITIEGQPQTFTKKGDKLVMTQGNMEMVFARSK